MSMDDDRVARIVAEAEQMINEIQRQIDAGEDFFREQGIDRQKMRDAVSPKEKEEAGRLLADDLAAVEREVAEGKARLAFSTPQATKSPARHRTMI